MILRGVGVRILAENVRALHDFYTEKLGFKVFWGDPNGPYVSFAEADGDKPVFAIFSKSNISLYQGFVPLTGSERTDQVVYCTGLDDVDAYYEELKNKGIELMGEPQNMYDWQYRCFYFRDPEGNIFEVAGAIK